jgi:tagatose 6-phosphate kinase
VIQCVCLNPVLQRTLTIEQFTLNTVNRVKGKALESSAGKGINAARAVKTLGHQAIITGFCGGETGERVEQALDREEMPYEFVHTANKTRICTTLLDPLQNMHTEIVEEGLPVAPSEVAAMMALYRKRLNNCSLVTISGTVPQQVPDTIYHDFVKIAAEQHISTLVDTQKNLLRECLKAHPFLVKVNRKELSAAFQENPDSREDLLKLVRRIVAEGVEWMVVTDGDRPTIVVSQSGVWDIIPPMIQAVNPIGAGDVTLGGIAAALAGGQDVVEAIQFGTACGSASTLTMTPGVIRRDDVKRIATEVRIMRNT